MKIERPETITKMPAEAKRVFKGVIFDVYQWEQEMYDGTKKIFERAKRPDTTIVFPVQSDGQILLTKQEQPAGRGPKYCGAGGRMEEGEDPFQSAQREMLEETGYQSNDWELWMALQPVAKLDWAVYVFIARNARKVSDMKPDSGEKIELLPVTFDQFLDIGTEENFAEIEIVPKIFEARSDPVKKAELKNLFGIA